MNLLLHICCGPCACYPVRVLQGAGVAVRGFFFNPNIHPFREFKLRLEALEQLAERWQLPVDYHRRYGLRDYLRQVVFNEEQRCRLCYEMRLAVVARQTRELGLEAFSSTLLYSRYQQHEVIREVAEQAARREGVRFYYRDFRPGWQEGIELSRQLELYRQPYCGCIYSEQERYDRGAAAGR
ncbi:epoxyqueuosine reductase QueH [Desulfurivibrio dismutans]|uniref:epoxyqueuosine reductase QueH n=1 Tax=Desulfurivibrio dismutans TaxID=1398908 RepID=UPI0023DB8894|nr:epoxyqueuosine reductase QueH [Desulfurivibrio alkaliphilus]MDF1615127.1 epoxyqueuosine reductase QueH [Desulfurivibrio alkaliphilus]